MESTSKPKTKTKLTSCAWSAKRIGGSRFDVQARRLGHWNKNNNNNAPKTQRNADDDDEYFLWSFVIWLQQTHKTRQEARTNKAALLLSPSRSLNSRFSAWMLLGTPRAAWPAASKQTNPEKTQLEIHKIPCTFSENPEEREEKWINNKQATRDAEQTTPATTTQQQQRRHSLRRIRFLRPAREHTHTLVQTLEPTLVRHSRVNRGQSLNASTIVSVHCAIVTKPTSRDLGLTKKLALNIKQHVPLSREVNPIPCNWQHKK